MDWTERNRIDLHMHTNVSDGTDSPEELLSRVREAGIGLFSVTDHDAIKCGRVLPALLRVGAYSYPLYLFEGLFLLRWTDWVTAMPAKWMADLAFFAGSAAAAVLYWNLYRRLEKRLAGRRA